MQQIQVLDSLTIDKIAAGEIVERPASVVKELTENAIDAGASAVTVEIENGGIDLIRVTDNGCGIPADQIRIAFCRHATSKIRTADDLLHVLSLGFRGEALSSIASVAQVELITKPAEQFTGSRYRIEGGREVSQEEVGAPDGTTILIKNLFYNTPARRKFLKTGQTEAGHVAALLERLALSRPDIAFRFINNRQLRLSTSGNGSLKDVIYGIYGRDITKHLLPVDYTSDRFSVTGFIGRPDISRGNRNYENYFINRRLIAGDLIVKAIEDAYKGFLMQHRYPFTALHFTIDTQLIDVNIHPGKVKLRFLQPEGIYEELKDLIRKVLSEQELIARVPLTQETKKTGAGPKPEPDPAERVEPFEKKRLGQPARQEETARRQETDAKQPEFSAEQLDRIREGIRADSPYEYKYPQRRGERAVQKVADDAGPESGPDETADDAGRVSGTGESADDAGHVPGPGETAIAAGRASGPNESNDDAAQAAGPADAVRAVTDAPGMSEFISAEAKPYYRMIGQVFDTYWMIEYQDSLYIIDQHAAHEKVLYERVMRRFKERAAEGAFHGQQIRPPIVLHLSMQEETLFLQYRQAFTDLGFEIEEFGSGSYVVRALPADLYGLNGQDVLIELIDGLDDPGHGDTPEMILEKLASMSCKAAVKGSRRLSQPEMEALLDELLLLDNPYFCPHGRPAIIAVSRREMDKKFKRIL